MVKHWEYNKNLDRSALYNVDLNIPYICGYMDEGCDGSSSKEANNNLLKNNDMFEIDFTYEECLGKNVFVKVMIDDVDHDTEVWPIAKLSDYEGLKEALAEYDENGTLEDYSIYE